MNHASVACDGSIAKRPTYRLDGRRRRFPNRGRLKLERLAGFVEGPDGREAAVDLLHERVRALLQHGVQLGVVREREADGAGERRGVPRVDLRFLPRPDFLLERRRAVRALAHFRAAPQARDDEEDVFEGDPPACSSQRH